ncbi:hypothetical protein [Streptomyces mangrovisoli]|uniref:Tetratricopeptide repeat protein n=1 Tax=Streptomyces mangrovisoli TaxID=1428628 RepID=A0A1J4NY19_9ACTN|nr:hypothetical protein [Streptomyces mangrovisoli]OIJ66938.1 hypothetical protein WN71_016110 [Streptomyces mangrovisoli]
MADHDGDAAPDGLLTRIGQVVMLHHAGDREEARDRLLALWTEIGAQGAALHRCTLAHYLADTQDDPTDQLAWDLRALAAAEELSDDHEDAPAVRALSPSLHLDLAADYVRLGRPEVARGHLGRARRAAVGLPEDRYGDGVRARIRRLEQRLDDRDPGGDWGPRRRRP